MRRFVELPVATLVAFVASPPEEVPSKYSDYRVSMTVCPIAYLKKHSGQTKFLYIVPIAPPLTTMQYIMYCTSCTSRFVGDVEFLHNRAYAV